jgi:hypothetical protein
LSYLGGFAVSVLATTFALPGESATERVASAGGAGRFDAWGYGLQAVLDRPLLGWGPGRFRAAVQGRFSADFTGANARNEVTQIWWDAHNIVVNVAVTLGIVGLGLAMAFAVFAVAQARGPLAWFAAVVASSWLLQPAGLATLPLVLFCLGAAAAASSFPGATGVGPSSARDNAAYVAILCGVAAASLIVLADVQVEAAIDKRSPDELASAANRVPWDPVVADLVSQAYSLYGTSPADLDHAIEWAGEAVERESDRPLYLNRLAVLQLATGQTEAARATLDRALSRQPWNVQTWSLLGVVAERSDDDGLRDRVTAASCAIEVSLCEPDG